MLCCICKDSVHRAIDCPFSWYKCPTTHHDADTAEAATSDQTKAAGPSGEPVTNAEDVPPTPSGEHDKAPDSLAGVVTPCSASASSGTATTIDTDDAHLEDPSRQFHISQLTDDSQVLVGAQLFDNSQLTNDSQLQLSTSGVLDSQGYIASTEGSSAHQPYAP